MGTNSGNLLEWLVVLLFVAAGFVVTVGEIVWLYRNRWAEIARSICYTIVSNAVGFIVGGGIILVIMLLLLMLVFETAERKNAWGGEATMWILVVGMFSVYPILLFLSKRLFLAAFRIRNGKQAWLFSLLSTLAVIFIGIALPSIVTYIITKGGSAK